MSLDRQICNVFGADHTFSFFHLNCQYTELACACLLKLKISYV